MPQAAPTPFQQWLLETPATPEGPLHEPAQHATHSWWQVMCLTGVDYFSSLAYQAGIAAVAAGAIAPIATLVLVALTLLGALPVYRRVAQESPNGEGSLLMLEKLLPGWPSKLLVLVLLGFAATDFMITITLSAADGAAHLVENPLFKTVLNGWHLPLTLFLVLLLGAVFLKGFKEAINIAVVLVGVYLGLNVIVIGRGLLEIAAHPSVFQHWTALLSQHQNGWAGVVMMSLIVFPKLALGMSGFETGVSVMPLVSGASADTPAQPTGRILNARKLLLTAALIMSALLITSSLVVTLNIDPVKLQDGGEASGRALAYLAHTMLGNTFGSIYDISTILILWFAGASAMTGLLNIVPRFLPRYGMAPNWARATRPLTLVFSAISVLITLIFRANVDAQGGAYATGVLVLMGSAAFAVTLANRRQGLKNWPVFGLVSVIFIYTIVLNVIERPDGLKIAAFFIAAILVVSIYSRLQRSTELRVEKVELDSAAQNMVKDAAQSGSLRIIAHRPDHRTLQDYRLSAREARVKVHMPSSDRSVLFLEINVDNASDFDESVLEISGHDVGGYRILRANAPAVPNAIAALLLDIRDETKLIPDVYFGWDNESPLSNAANFFLFGQGDIAPLTREVLRRAEPDQARRPLVHVGG